MLCKRGLYRHAVSVRLSVCVSVTFVHSVKTNKHIVRIFCTKRHGNIPTGTPLTKALNGCGVGRNRDSEPISGFTACCEPFHAGNTYVNDRKLLWCRPLAATTAGEVFSGVFMVRPPPPWSDREFWDNFCTAFASFVSQLSRKSVSQGSTQTYHSRDKNDLFSGRGPVPSTTPILTPRRLRRLAHPYWNPKWNTPLETTAGEVFSGVFRRGRCLWSSASITTLLRLVNKYDSMV